MPLWTLPPLDSLHRPQPLLPAHRIVSVLTLVGVRIFLLRFLVLLYLYMKRSSKNKRAVSGKIGAVVLIAVSQKINPANTWS